MSPIHPRLAMLKPALVAGSLAAALLSSTAAFAQTSPEGAAKLADSIRKGLEMQKNISKSSLEVDGDVKVVPNGDSYDVTFPRIKSTDAEKSFTIDFGVAHAKMTPKDEKGVMDYTAQIDKITVLDQDGKPSATLSSADQDISGSWDSVNNMALGADIELKKIAVDILDKSATVAVDSVTYKADPTEKNGLYSGTGTATVNDIAIAKTGSANKVTIDKVAVESTMEDMDMVRYRQAMNDAAAAAGPDAGPEAAFPAIFKAFGSIGDLKMKTELDGLEITGDDGMHVKMKSADFGAGIDGTKEKTSNVTFTLGHEGLEVTPPKSEADEVPKGLVPTRSRLTMTLANVPNDKMGPIFEQYTQDVAKVGPEVASMNLGQQIMPIFSEGGAQVQLNTLEVDTPDAGVSGKGNADFDTSAAAGLTAGFDIAVRGLEKVTQDIQAKTQSGNAEVSDEYSNLLAGLGMLQAFGKKEEGITGTTHNYKIEIDKAGSLGVNGTPMTSLAGSGAGADGGDEEAPQ